eukprot:jgi/Bigna1/88693/estExt_fgenesh1_pg.C_360114
MAADTSSDESLLQELRKAIEKHESTPDEKSEDIKACEACIGSVAKRAHSAQQIIHHLIKENLLKSILYHLPEFSPKARQDIKHIWLISLKSEVLRKEMDDYIRANPEILILLVRGYTKDDSMVQTYGDILRFSIKHEAMFYMILFSPLSWQFFNFVTAEEYAKSADAFKTFKIMLTRNNGYHRKHVAGFLKKNFTKFFGKFRELLTDDRYHVKRQALRLLSDVLQAKANFSIMVKYISQPSNLELMIKHLCQNDNQKKGIKSEAFHVFKFFVANPRKPECIVEVLAKNKTKLISTLEEMEKDGSDYGQELPLLIKRLKQLPAK